MAEIKHLSLAELEAGLEMIRQAPRDEGQLELIVRRPETEVREALQEGLLDLSEGLVGETGRRRGSSRTADGSAHPDMQLNVMNAASDRPAGAGEGALAAGGDQLYIDLDLSAENLPPGTRLALGSAVIEITHQPHTGCAKFMSRFGVDALKFVNSDGGEGAAAARVERKGSAGRGDPGGRRGEEVVRAKAGCLG